jgi:hypothetical protein
MLAAQSGMPGAFLQFIGGVLMATAPLVIGALAALVAWGRWGLVAGRPVRFV